MIRPFVAADVLAWKNRPRPAVMRQVVYCPRCKTAIRVDPDQGMATCTNPQCRQQITITNPTFQRGGCR